MLLSSRWVSLYNFLTPFSLKRKRTLVTISALEEITMSIGIRVSTKDRLIKYGFMQNVARKRAQIYYHGII